MVGVLPLHRCVVIVAEAIFKHSLEIKRAGEPRGLPQ